MKPTRHETQHPAPGSTNVHRPGGASSPEPATEVLLAENATLRERVGRLEASIAFWTTDLEESSSENQRLRDECEHLKRQLREAEDRLASSADTRAQLTEELSERDDHIALLESRMVEVDMGEIEAQRTRHRLLALRRRVRAKMVTQAEEIAGLRRTLALGHAARTRVESELRSCKLDAKRNARYLDRLEDRLAAAESRRP